jgi:predicted nuclease of restriction endonuclease-like (RecB) superfamily
MVTAYWLIGREIVEEEQKGQERAKYGSYLLSELSFRLTNKYGKGFSIGNLKHIRQFYIAYQGYCPIGYALRSQFNKELNPNLSWLHYRTLMRITRDNARSFYEIEALKNNWSGRELERQISSLLFERLALSKDKEGVLELAIKGQEINKPEDAIKEPLVLEFLNIPESHKLVESRLEQALIDNLQHFLLELGSGFAFVARQKRLTLEGDHFYADLVFYHTKLKCYVVIDLKTHKLGHADIGQILMYVNYFDREVKDETDNPTIGLVLCSEKNDTMVKYMLNENNQQIFASKYKLYLPTEEELRRELQKEVAQVEQELKQLDDNSKHE